MTEYLPAALRFDHAPALTSADSDWSAMRQRRAQLVRFGAQYAIDAGWWAVAVIIAQILRYEFGLPSIQVIPTLWAIACLALLQLAAGWAFRLYQGRFAYGTFEEVRSVALAALLVGAIVGIPLLLFGTVVGLPRSTLLIALPFGLVAMLSTRYLKRLALERRNRPGDESERVIVYGAGRVGATIVRLMLSNPESRFLPVAMLDDDPASANLQHGSVVVRGTMKDLERVARETNATVVLVAIARADSRLLRRVDALGAQLGLRVKVLPQLDEIISGTHRFGDLRDVSIEDLMGRHAVDTDVDSIAGYLRGRRVLITGAGGSIGSELCSQVMRFGPAELIMLDRDESGLQSAQLRTSGHGLLDTRDVVLVDIRDMDALNAVFEMRRPEVVFHAAALKHLPMLEQYADEAWKTNVLGTRNVLQAAARVGVTTFVNISTDKAADPTSVLGHSKRVAEKLTAWTARDTAARYLSVRFGNVIGSRGSMLPTFTALIEAGRPLTVTHPEVTRYFMTIPEACQLVVQAGAIGQPADVMILDMGEPVRILDVAKRMISMSGREIDIVYTGLRAGEKLHEDLVGTEEHTTRSSHPKISQTHIDGLAPDDLCLDTWRAGIARTRVEGTSAPALAASGGGAPS